MTPSIVSFWLTHILKSPNHQCRCSKTNLEIDCVSTSQDNIANGSNYILLFESFLRRFVGQSFWKKHPKPHIILFLIPCSSMYLYLSRGWKYLQLELNVLCAFYWQLYLFFHLSITFLYLQITIYWNINWFIRYNTLIPSILLSFPYYQL